MQIDLTPEEMNLISSLFSQSSLTMNRESMTVYIRMTDSVLSKFNAANSPANSTTDNNQGEPA